MLYKLQEEKKMAFNPENKKITEAVKKTPDLPKKREENKTDSQETVFTIPKMKVENTKNYTFSMKPKIRKKLSKLSKTHGFKSDSAFLTYLIEHVE